LPRFGLVWPPGTRPELACSIPSGPFLAEVHLEAGQFAEALAILDRAAETAAEIHYQAELARLRGVATAQTGSATEAAHGFSRRSTLLVASRRDR
jgi:predicted negative regulator of RcsB-dependent stress response